MSAVDLTSFVCWIRPAKEAFLEIWDLPKLILAKCSLSFQLFSEVRFSGFKNRGISAIERQAKQTTIFRPINATLNVMNLSKLPTPYICKWEEHRLDLFILLCINNKDWKVTNLFRDFAATMNAVAECSWAPRSLYIVLYVSKKNFGVF